MASSVGEINNVHFPEFVTIKICEYLRTAFTLRTPTETEQMNSNVRWGTSRTPCWRIKVLSANSQLLFLPPMNQVNTQKFIWDYEGKPTWPLNWTVHRIKTETYKPAPAQQFNNTRVQLEQFLGREFAIVLFITSYSPPPKKKQNKTKKVQQYYRRRKSSYKYFHTGYPLWSHIQRKYFMIWKMT